MTSIGKLIFGFLILGICFVGAMMIFAQQISTPISNYTIGNTSDILDNASAINQTTGLVSTATSFGTGVGVMLLMIVGALIVIAALALIVGRKR